MYSKKTWCCCFCGATARMSRVCLIGVPRADAAPGLWPMRVAYFTEETPADM
ncbi:hypothetical protein SAMN05444165_2254 [Paraburkholderia phenazinium]|uniref:Uncharacterized protein n=1 Tax=Paraburkholderia phenazinium TaxID=60549 RepID=A0A1N6IKT5_9BURK|nr:hypothetical protein SAMN05444165_2254 [Paraburkholderia phenazinium]